MSLAAASSTRSTPPRTLVASRKRGCGSTTPLGSGVGEGDAGASACEPGCRSPHPMSRSATATATMALRTLPRRTAVVNRCGLESSSRKRDVHDEAAVVRREIVFRSRVRLRADYAESPHVVNPLRWILAERRRPRLLSQVTEACLIKELDLDGTGFRVEIAGHHHRGRVGNLAQDGPHLVLAHECAVSVVIEVRPDDEEIADPHEQRAPR